MEVTSDDVKVSLMCAITKVLNAQALLTLVATLNVVGAMLLALVLHLLHVRDLAFVMDLLCHFKGG